MGKGTAKQRSLILPTSSCRKECGWSQAPGRKGKAKEEEEAMGTLGRAAAVSLSFCRREWEHDERHHPGGVQKQGRGAQRKKSEKSIKNGNLVALKKPRTQRGPN